MGIFDELAYLGSDKTFKKVKSKTRVVTPAGRTYALTGAPKSTATPDLAALALRQSEAVKSKNAEEVNKDGHTIRGTKEVSPKDTAVVFLAYAVGADAAKAEVSRLTAPQDEGMTAEEALTEGNRLAAEMQQEARDNPADFAVNGK